MTAVLLVETTQGSHVAVRFSTIEAARDWEDESGVIAVGAIPVVSRTEALRQAGV